MENNRHTKDINYLSDYVDRYTSRLKIKISFYRKEHERLMSHLAAIQNDENNEEEKREILRRLYLGVFSSLFDYLYLKLPLEKDFLWARKDFTAGFYKTVDLVTQIKEKYKHLIKEDE